METKTKKIVTMILVIITMFVVNFSFAQRPCKTKSRKDIDRKENYLERDIKKILSYSQFPTIVAQNKDQATLYREMLDTGKQIEFLPVDETSLWVEVFIDVSDSGGEVLTPYHAYALSIQERMKLRLVPTKISGIDCMCVFLSLEDYCNLTGFPAELFKNLKITCLRESQLLNNSNMLDSSNQNKQNDKVYHIYQFPYFDVYLEDTSSTYSL